MILEVPRPVNIIRIQSTFTARAFRTCAVRWSGQRPVGLLCCVVHTKHGVKGGATLQAGHPRLEDDGEKQDCLEVPKTTTHSCRNAVIGFKREAFTAGYVPKNSPMLTAITKPARTDHAGTLVGRPGMISRTRRLSRKPARIPSDPPLPSRSQPRVETAT
jgi:hypothetical protein